MNGLTDIQMGNSFRYSHSSRGHDKNLYHFYSRTDVRKYFFANRIVNNWDKLSPEIVNASHKHFKDAVYSMNFIGRGSVETFKSHTPWVLAYLYTSVVLSINSNSNALYPFHTYEPYAGFWPRTVRMATFLIRTHTKRFLAIRMQIKCLEGNF